MDSKKEYIFIVNKWMSNWENESTSYTIDVATRQQLRSFCYLFFEYFELFASNVWLWRILSPNHDGNLNRKERIILLYVKIMISACTMAMFFGKTSIKKAEEEEENPSLFFLNIARTLYVLFVSSVISTLISAIIEGFFRHSKFVHENYDVYKNY